MNTSLRMTAALGAAALALAGLSACSSTSGSAESSAPAPSVSAVGGMTTCDNATLQASLSEQLAGNGMQVDSVDGLECSDGWAVVQATISDGTDPGTGDQYIFEAEGQFWIPKQVPDVCGTFETGATEAPSDAVIPADLWVQACTTN